MKKLNTLLHDVTVFNFLLLAKLCKRYKYLSLAAFMAFCGFSCYSYFSQVTIHTKKVYFKVIAPDEAKSTKNILESLNSIANTLINQNELSSIVYSYEFTNSLANQIVALPNFKDLDFNSPHSRATLSHSEMFKNCSTNDCNAKVLRGILPGLYKIETDVTTGKFILSVMSRTDDVTLEIITHFKKVLEDSRLQAKIVDVESQILQTQELILKSRSDIESKGGFARVASNESLEAEITLRMKRSEGFSISSAITSIRIIFRKSVFSRVELRRIRILMARPCFSMKTSPRSLSVLNISARTLRLSTQCLLSQEQRQIMRFLLS